MAFYQQAGGGPPTGRHSFLYIFCDIIISLSHLQINCVQYVNEWSHGYFHPICIPVKLGFPYEIMSEFSTYYLNGVTFWIWIQFYRLYWTEWCNDSGSWWYIVQLLSVIWSARFSFWFYLNTRVYSQSKHIIFSLLYLQLRISSAARCFYNPLSSSKQQETKLYAVGVNIHQFVHIHTDMYIQTYIHTCKEIINK